MEWVGREEDLDERGRSLDVLALRCQRLALPLRGAAVRALREALTVLVAAFEAVIGLVAVMLPPLKTSRNASAITPL